MLKRLLVVAILGGWSALPAFALAANKNEKTAAAEEAVREALHREIYGLAEERAALLRQALQDAPDCAAARWHAGEVRVNNKWVKIDELAKLSAEDARLAAYAAVREGHGNTVESQLELANWCRKRGLAAQERAHLTQVLALNPEHAEARARLGFRRVDGGWMTQGEMERHFQQAALEAKSIAKWREEVERVVDGLRDRSENRQKLAKERLDAITDPTAIPALEGMLSLESPDAALAVVNVIARMPVHEAAVSLAKHAVFSPWPAVREAAAVALRDRQTHEYAPAMLATLSTPLDASASVFQDAGGRLVYRHGFVREGQDSRDLLLLDTAYRRRAIPNGDRRETLARVLADIQADMQARQTAVELENRRATAMNERVALALNTATGQNLPAQAQNWWDWWNNENEVFAGQKQTRVARLEQQINVRDQAQAGGQGGEQSAAQMPMDCLAAGTRVWTLSGPAAIESVKVGDLVLARDQDSGELALKPVLRVTVRPASPLVKIHMGAEAIETSGGHLFWVSGEGWTRARHLKPGMELHGAQGPTRVTLVEPGRHEQTYNLIVADFNSYFVGDAQVLSHDNTPRRPTNAIVPGLRDK